MKPQDNELPLPAGDGSLTSPEQDESGRIRAENTDHPIRRMIRRVRAAHAPGRIVSDAQSASPAATWDRQSETPLGLGSTEYSNLQGFAKCLEGDASQLDPDESRTDLPNQIGRFEIQRILGAGGFGWVLLADDPQLNRPVALKVPRLDTLISQTGRVRFLREARAAALLSHPSLVSVYEAGQVGPILYIAFEWVDGQSLSQWLSDHRDELDSKSIAQLMAALAHAVQHAHQRGIIHRDLKPSNILIKQGDPQATLPVSLAERAKIADFGLAFLAENNGELTRSGALMGTPRYLAPEQIQSSGAQSEPTIDVYGLGAVMYELLTGQAPFSGATLAAIVRAVEQDAPLSPRKLNPAVSRDLEAICLKCLEKSPDQRYRSAVAMAEDLERFLDGVPVRARRPNFLERSWRWIQRNRLITLAFATGILSLTLGLLVASYQARISNRRLVETQQQRLRADRHRNRAENAVDTLLNEVADSLEAMPQMQPLRRRLLQKALEHERAAMSDEGDDPDSQLRVAESLWRIADLQFRLGEFDPARESCQELQQLLDGLQTANSEQRARSDIFRAKSQLLVSRILLNRGSPAEAEEQLRNLILKPATDSDPEWTRLRATALSLHGLSHRDRGDLQSAELSYIESAATLRSIPQQDRMAGDERDIASMMSLIGGLRYAKGQYDQAIEIWKEVAELKFKETPDLPQNILRGNRAAGLANLGMAYSFKGDLPTSLNYYQQSNDQYRELCLQFPLHLDHASGRLSALIGRAVAQQNAGQMQAAIDSFREGIAWGEQMIPRFGTQPRVLTELSRAHGNLGNILQFKGDEAAAMEAWNRGLNYVRQNLQLHPGNGTGLGDLTFALCNLAGYHLQKNQLEPAAALIEEAKPAAQQALAALPGNQKIINATRSLRANEAMLQCLSQDHEAALLSIAKIVELQPDRHDSVLFAAKTAASCQLAVAENRHERFGGDDDQGVGERYANRALELLASARQLGFRDFNSLKQRPEFIQIVTRPEFELLQSGE